MTYAQIFLNALFGVDTKYNEEVRKKWIKVFNDYFEKKSRIDKEKIDYMVEFHEWLADYRYFKPCWEDLKNEIL